MTNTLVFAYGNLSRGDDALGPLVAEAIEKNASLTEVDVLTDFQLQIEHALDLEGRELVLFIDASVACEQVFALTRLLPEKDNSYTTHAMSPAAVLAVYESVVHQQPPPCFLLSIQALEFELGTELTEQARDHLKQATVFAEHLLLNADLNYWQECVSHA